MNHDMTSVVVTTFNEEKTILQLLKSLVAQTTKPAEIIICDSQSTDGTQKIITQFQHTSVIPIKLISKKGNRSMGRNAAIEAASTGLIAITDAGCEPAYNWLEELLKKYHQSRSPIIAGYYKGAPKTAFEEAVVPYVLVMPDKVDENNFLPATRSMLIEKRVWKNVGGFDEHLSFNEDYPFAKKLQKTGYSISFARAAVVAWQPRRNLKEFSTMIEHFALGDIQAGILRPKVVLIFVRYIIGLLLLVYIWSVSSWLVVISVLMISVAYGGWAIMKNEKYLVNGWYWLPILQVVSDFCVMKGTIRGWSNYQKK